jgi:S1-C subfamily serine protease
LRTINKFLIVGAIAFITGICLSIWDERRSGEEPVGARGTSTATASALLPHQSATLDLPSLAKHARTAVVSIEVFDDEANSIGGGSAFFVSNDGLLVTNYHVIEKASRAVAKTEGGDQLSITDVAYVDRENDLAVLAAIMPPGKVSFLHFGNSAQVDVGDRVAVIGNPLGLEGSLSEGIVSAKRDKRSMLTPQANPGAGTSVGEHEWLQITAAISPGSSGSPVLDASGNVIGVATMGVRGGESLNFAVPAEVAIAMMRTEAKQDSTQRRLIPLKELAAANEETKFKIEQEAEKSCMSVFGALMKAEGAAKNHRVADWNEVLNLAKALVSKYPPGWRVLCTIGRCLPCNGAF